MVKLTAAEEDVKDYVINHVLNTTASYSMIKLKAKDNINIKGTLSITCDDRAPILLDINKVVKRSELESFSMLGVTPIESTFPSINLYTAYPIPPTQHIPGHVFGSPNVRVPKPIRHKAGGKLMVANSEVTRTSHKRSQPSSRDISQSLTMPSVNSDHQESILHIASQSNITPITIVPETVNGGDEPQNLTIKEETTSGTENMEHSAPLNMSVKEKQSQHHNTPVNSPLLEQSEESLPNQVPPPKQQVSLS